ncbi:MAG: sigma-70 family RNA polymerase sigma factor [Gemmatimonadetes bacterium]|nr:sigma-70 family RNA polymerase sigma factor [Gemmatimonadota bacterium]
MNRAEDVDLVRRARDGDEAAFSDLVERHQGRVYNHALRMMGNVQDAEEVLQDTFVQAYRNLAKFEERSRFSTWIYRIATNEALMRLRKASRKAETSFEDLAHPDGEAWHEALHDFTSALDDVQSTEIREALEKALVELPEEYRIVFTLRDIDGFTNAEVADILEISVAAVKSRLHRSRLFLRDRLAQFHEETRTRTPQPRKGDA